MNRPSPEMTGTSGSVESTPSLKDFTQSFDARDWAREFVKIARAHPSISTDEGAMIGWFANAIMRGYDDARAKYEPSGELILIPRKEVERLHAMVQGEPPYYSLRDVYLATEDATARWLSGITQEAPNGR